MPKPPHVAPQDAEAQRLYCLPITLSHLPSLVIKTPRYLNLGQDLIPNLEGAVHPFPAEDHGLGFRGASTPFNFIRIASVVIIIVSRGFTDTQSLTPE